MSVIRENCREFEEIAKSDYVTLGELAVYRERIDQLSEKEWEWFFGDENELIESRFDILDL